MTAPRCNCHDPGTFGHVSPCPKSALRPFDDTTPADYNTVAGVTRETGSCLPLDEALRMSLMRRLVRR